MGAQWVLFNGFNKGTVVSDRSVSYGTPAYLQPSSVLQARIVRLGMQMR